MSTASAPTQPAVDEARPLGLVFVYTWDILRFIFALVAALASFSGAVEVAGRDVAIPTWAQVIAALSYASYAGCLFVVAAVLGRRQRWVRSVQTGSLLIALVLAVASGVAQRLSDVAAIEGIAGVVVVDLLAMAVMFTPRVRTWFVEPGRTPMYVTVLLAFWTIVSVGFTIYLAILAA